MTAAAVPAVTMPTTTAPVTAAGARTTAAAVPAPTGQFQVPLIKHELDQRVLWRGQRGLLILEVPPLTAMLAQ